MSGYAAWASQYDPLSSAQSTVNIWMRNNNGGYGETPPQNVIEAMEIIDAATAAATRVEKAQSENKKASAQTSKQSGGHHKCGAPKQSGGHCLNNPQKGRSRCHLH